MQFEILAMVDRKVQDYCLFLPRDSIWYMQFLFVCFYYYYFFVGLRTLVVGLSVYCSDSEPGWEKTKQLQKKMTS